MDKKVSSAQARAVVRLENAQLAMEYRKRMGNAKTQSQRRPAPWRLAMPAWLPTH